MTTLSLSNDTKNNITTACPVYGEFYENFIQGVLKRVRGDIRSDLGISIEVMYTILRLLDTWYLDVKDSLAKK